MPSFPGGDSERLKFLSKNIRYPQQAAENGIQGPVYISFVVKTSGILADVKILQGIGGGCDEEAIRVVKKMPRWNPGYLNGKKVAVLFNMKIDFRLQ
jgi:protein TonB